MPAEGPNKSEERLQRYAKERRGQGGDFSLHPATRRLLQGEVARQFGTSPREERTWRQWLGLWQGRLVLGGGAAALVLVGFAVLWNERVQQSRTMNLAKADVAPRANRSVMADEEFESRTPAPAAAPVPALQEALAEKQVASRGARRLNEEADEKKEIGARMAGLDVAQKTQASATRGFDESYSVQAGRTNSSASFALADNAAGPAPGISSGGAGGGAKSDVSARYRLSLASPSNGTPADVATAGGVGYGLASNAALLADNGARYYDRQQPARSLAFNYGTVESTSAAPRPELEKNQPDRRLALAPAAVDSIRPSAAAPVNAPAAAAAPSATAQPSALGGALGAARPAGASALRKANDAPAEIVSLRRVENSADSTMFFRQVVTQSERESVGTRNLAETLQRTEPVERTSPVLDHFTVEQRGRTIRIVEADGSFYEGDIETPLTSDVALRLDASGTRDKDADGLAREENVTLNESKLKRSQNYSFRASGTNVTLKQLIVVNGRLTHSAGGAYVAARGIDVESRNAALATRPAAPTPQQPVRFAGGAGTNAMTNSSIVLEGTVRIGTTNVQRLKAVSQTQ